MMSNVSPAATESTLLGYLKAQTQSGRGDYLQGLYYLVISDADRELFPELNGAYAIAIKHSRGETEYWLLATEAAYDDEILLALSMLGESPDDSPMVQ
jgi:hypothetical protein